MQVPQSTQAIVLQKNEEQRKAVYHDAKLQTIPLSPPKPGQVVVKMGAAAFNHRDVWIRMGQYPGISLDSVLGADGAGTVVASGDSNDPLLNERVFLTPMRGWESGRHAPESRFGILGGTKHPSLGTFAEYVTVDRDQVIRTPKHLDDVHAAAWPLAGLTAWRALSVHADIQPEQKILITGIGGGVALLAMQICIIKGAYVYVTSGSDDKIKEAIAMGARGGTKYRDQHWPDEIGRQLKQNQHDVLDAVLDSGGGDIFGKIGKYLKQGGKVVCYGMTADTRIPFTMREVLRHQQLIGTSMGSRQDLEDATAFLAMHRIVPVVSQVLDGLEEAERGFEMMRHGAQFGKIVMKIRRTERGKL